jgi:hypothetical protein
MAQNLFALFSEFYNCTDTVPVLEQNTGMFCSKCQWQSKNGPVALFSSFLTGLYLNLRLVPVTNYDTNSVADPYRDSGSGAILPLGSGMIFCRIPELGFGPFFVEIFLHYLQNHCYLYETGLLLKLTLETIILAYLLVCLVLLPPFYIGLSIRDQRPGSRDPDPG